MSRRYCLISPCRDEAAFIRRTLDSVTAQTLTPALWVIVDDGSTDETPAILAEYSRRFPYIRVVQRQDRGRRSVGPGVIQAFYEGYATIDPRQFDYLCKLDVDLDLPPRYFETLIERLEADPRLGTCSGKPYYVDPGSGRLISEKCGDEMSVGMTKLYRVECFEQIGGFVHEVMWDGIDCHRCRMLGWIACSWDDPELRFTHLRPMGSSEVGIWTGRVRHGRGQHFMGTSFPYILASALYRMTRPPLLVGGLAILWGYASRAFSRAPRYGDAEFRRFLGKYQWDCLLRGKAAATRRLHDAIPPPSGRTAFPRASMTLDAGEPQGRLHDGAQPLPSVLLHGVRFHAIREKECARHIVDELARGRGGFVVTPNLDHLRRAQRSPEYLQLVRSADLSVADGMPLVWASRLQGTPLPERVPGSSLVSTLAAEAAKAGRSLFLLGGDPGAADGAATVLSSRSPGLRIAGTHCPPPGFEVDEREMAALTEKLCRSQPDLVYVGLGSPKQELLIARLRPLLPRTWWLGVGISFSFLCGQVRRAPPWMQKLGLEWLHRWIQEPGRLSRRYFLEGLPFAARLFTRAMVNRVRGSTWRARQNAKAPPAAPS